LGDQRNAEESNFNSGDGTGKMAQHWMFMMMMMMMMMINRQKTVDRKERYNEIQGNPLNPEKRINLIKQYPRIYCSVVLSLVRMLTSLYTRLATETLLADGETVQAA
jgi:hypothetical protein